MVEQLKKLLQSFYNKLKKGELNRYSESEQQIGYWIDGSPLYRRIITLSSALSIPSNAWTDTLIDVSYIEELIDARAFYIDSNGRQKNVYHFSFTTSLNNKISVISFRNAPTTIHRIMVEYTKTTD